MEASKSVAEPEKTIHKANKDSSNSNYSHQEESEHHYRLLVAKFIIQHDLPFTFADQFDLLDELLSKFSPKNLFSFIVNCHHVRMLARKAILPCLQAKLLKHLETSPFSISVDEGSAKGRIKYLAIGARFFVDNLTTKTSTKLLGLMEMNGS